MSVTHWPRMMRCIMVRSRMPEALLSWQKGRRPVSIWYRMTPAAQTSVLEASYDPLLKNTSGAM